MQLVEYIETLCENILKSQNFDIALYLCKKKNQKQKTVSI